MSLDINYYKKYLNSYADDNAQLIVNLSSQYNKQYHEAISPFSILINTDRAEKVTVKTKDTEKEVYVVIDYSKKITKERTNPLNREVWSAIDEVNLGDYIYRKIKGEEKIYLNILEGEEKQDYDISYIKECNNTLNWYLYDSNSNKKLIQQPCIIDNKITQTTFNYSESIILSQNTLTITTQNNANIKNISENNRFLFDGVPFKVQMKNAWQREQTMNSNSAPLIYLSCIKDQISPLDDLENNIADGLPAKDITNTSIIIALTTIGEGINPNKIKVNHTQTYSVYKYDEQNNKSSNTFTITASGCDPSYYTLTIIDGNNFSITNLKGNGTQYLTAHCVDNVDNKSEDIKIRLVDRW